MNRLFSIVIATGSLVCVYCAARANPVVRETGAQNVAAPAEILAETRLGPEGGNGTHPFMAAVDTRRNRLWILNQVPQSLSVVDLATQRVVDTIQLSSPLSSPSATTSTVPVFDGWGNSAPYIWIGYDYISDRVLVGANDSSGRGVLVSVDAGTRRIEAVRTLKDCLSYRWAINAKRGEVVVAGLGKRYPGGFGLLEVNVKTLQTQADFATRRQVEAMAASERTGRLYTVEPSKEHPATCGMGGPYSSTKVFVRNPVSGAIVSRSSGDFAYPGALFVDVENNRLYLVHRSTDLHVISSELNTVSVISQSTLKSERTIHYADRTPNGREYVGWGLTYFDVSRHRLVADLYGGTLAILPLTGPARATEFPVEGSKYSDYRLAGVLQPNGRPFLLIDNAVQLLNANTLQPSESITLGCAVQNLFLDVKRHRLVAYVDRGAHEFLMLENNLPRRLFNSRLLQQTQLLAVDFDNERIISVYTGSRDSGDSVDAMNFLGEKTTGGLQVDGDYFGMILTDAPGGSFRLLAPESESVFALPRCSLDRLDHGHQVKSVALSQLSSTNRPSQLLYASHADRIYVVFGQTMNVYSGSDLSEVNSVSLARLPFDRAWGRLQGSLAVDPAGRFAYFADSEHNQIFKLRLNDGSIIDRRNLGFAPTLPLVDSGSERIYLADNNGGRVVAIRIF